MYEALAQSKNAPAVWLLNQIGVNKGYQSVKKFGLPVTKSDDNLALALGGLSTGVSPQQLASAYTTFANGGTLMKPYYIRKIVDSTGKVVVDNTQKPTGKRIISENVAKQMTSMMLGVFTSGTGVDAKPAGYSVAGKTGSTEADSSADGQATKDKWIVGYTPDLVLATWEGFDSTNANRHLENLSGSGVGPLFQNEMSGMLPYTKNTQFNTDDAQTIVANRNKNKNKASDSFWGGVQEKADEYANNIGQGANEIKQKAADFINGLF